MRVVLGAIMLVFLIAVVLDVITFVAVLVASAFRGIA